MVKRIALHRYSINAIGGNMKYTKDIIEDVETYKGYKIVIEHNLNIFENVKETDDPIYTICRMGRCFQGTIEDTKKFIDDMFLKYRNE